MKNIKSYSYILESFRERKAVVEKAMNPDRVSRIIRLKDANDISSYLKELEPIKDQIIKICSDIDYKDIEYSKRVDIIKISYKSPVVTLLSTLKDDCELFGDIIYDKVFGDGYDDLHLEIELDSKNLNRIDIINGLPNFIKGIGLGKYEKNRRNIMKLNKKSEWFVLDTSCRTGGKILR